MIRCERRTGFEWLDQSFFITRVLATAWGLIMAVLLLAGIVEVVDDLRRRILPPPPPPASDEEGEVLVRTRCFGPERNPYDGLAVAFWLVSPPIAGAVLVWRKPRIGFALTAGSWFMGGTLAAFGIERLDWRLFALWLLPTLWLSVAAWKVRPSPPPDPEPVIYVEEPDPAFHWLDSAVGWLLRLFHRRSGG
jgi:hypothetical protein